MNYIEEELARQAGAFAALLGGGRGESADAQRTSREADADGGDQAGAGDTAPATHAGVSENRIRRTAANAAEAANEGAELADMAARLRQKSARNAELAAAALGLGEDAGAKEPPLPGPMSPARGTGPAPAGESAGTDGGSRRSPGTEAGEKQAARELAQTIFVEDGGLTAMELSRAFQRDARRYDGGYPLY